MNELTLSEFAKLIQDEAYRLRRRGRTSADDDTRGRLLHRIAGEGRDRRHQPVQIGGSAGELCGSRPVPQQLRDPPPSLSPL